VEGVPNERSPHWRLQNKFNVLNYEETQDKMVVLKAPNPSVSEFSLLCFQRHFKIATGLHGRHKSSKINRQKKEQMTGVGQPELKRDEVESGREDN